MFMIFPYLATLYFLVAGLLEPGQGRFHAWALAALILSISQAIWSQIKAYRLRKRVDDLEHLIKERFPVQEEAAGGKDAAPPAP